MTEPSPTPVAPPSNTEIGTALGLLYAGTLVLLVLSMAVPALVSLQQAVLAVLLLTLPSFVLKRYAAPLTIDDLGVGLGPWKRTLGVSLATMAVVFSVFAVGFHVWTTEVVGARAVFHPSQLLRWGEDLERMPARLCDKRSGDRKVRVWFDRRGAWIMGPTDRRLAVSVRSGPEPIHTARAARCTSGGSVIAAHTLRPTDGAVAVPKGFGLWLPLQQQMAVEMTFQLDGQPLPDGGLVTGQYERSADADEPLSAQLSLWWILTYIIVHLGLVALPEEWFFRGYLQPRLDQRFGTPLRLLGADLGWGFVLSAAAFAILHPILVPGFHRLAVFFPALLFGWLRARTGNIGAAVVVHACANLLQQLLSRLYV